MASSPALSADALLGMLFPLWQLIIGILVLVAVVVSVHRLARRGPTRMGAAMLLIGGAMVCIAVIGILFQEF